MEVSGEHPKIESQTALSQAYQPIVRGYFLVAAAYYAIMGIAFLVTMEGAPLAVMLGITLVTSLAAAIAARIITKPLPTHYLETITTTINMLVLLNVVVALGFEYNQAKLIYFVIMAMIFALSAVTFRQACFSIAMALAGLLHILLKHNPEQVMIYSFVCFATGMSAAAITYFLQRAIHVAVSARKDAERRLEKAEELGEEMRQQSLSDSLTGLPNRRAFFQHLEQLRQAEDARPIWLALLDLDGFKGVNDNFGHIMGDALLREVAERLQAHCDGAILVSRMGGDEFNILFSHLDSEAEVIAWCEAMLARIGETYLIEDRMIRISGSVGCYQLRDGESDTEVTQKADYALLHAKKTGKNRVVLFLDEHQSDAARRYEVEQALRGADFAAEIELLFQPQFDLQQHSIFAAEALARWNSPALGHVSPEIFIKIAEESGIIPKITLTVVEKALGVIKQMAGAIPLSINLSGHDLMSDQMIDQIIALVAASGIDPALLEFEVTETAMMADTSRASANLLRLASLGHTIALDDFGTGYSNFTYLRTLPISKLKVDRSFMENIGDPMTEKILHSLVGMARTLGVTCLLEGIETDLELLMAKRVGAHLAQGYLFSTPIAADDLMALYAKLAPSPASVTMRG